MAVSSRIRLLTIAITILVIASGLPLAEAFLKSPSTRASAITATGSSGGAFVPAVGRIVDTRNSVGWSTAFQYNQWRTITPIGKYGVPSDAAAVQVTVSAVNPTTPGIVYVRPTGGTSMPALSFNQGVGGSTSNTAIVALGPDGTFDMVANTTVDIVVDVQGYFTAGEPGAGGFVPAERTRRIVDTRNGTGLPNARIAQNTTVTINIGRVGGVPSDASAVFVNLEVLNNSSSAGFVQPYAADEANPGTSMSFAGGAGTHTSLGTTVELSDSGEIKIRYGSAPAGSNIDLVIDVAGYYTAARGSASGFAGFTPSAGQLGNPVTITAGATQAIAVAGAYGIPNLNSGLVAIAASIKLDDAGSGHGFLSMWADDRSRPSTVVADYSAASTRSNFATVEVGTGGGVKLYNGGSDSVTVTITIQGWYLSARAIDADLEPLYRQATAAAGLDATLIEQGLYVGPANNQVVEALVSRRANEQASESELELLEALGLALDLGELTDDIEPTPAEVRAAVAELDAAVVVASPDTALPNDGTEPAIVRTLDGTLAVDLPAQGPALASGPADSMFAGSAAGTAVAAQSMDDGVRTLIHIESRDAPERFDFPMGGDVAAVRLTDGGGIEALNGAGEVIVAAPAPWAVDQNGTAVPTHYEINGTTVTQVVSHKSGLYAYGIVADPSWWWWSKNIAVCGVQIASVLVPGKVAQVGAKLAKAAKSSTAARRAKAAVDDMGGVSKALKNVGTYLKNKGDGLSATNKARVESLLTQGSAVVVDVLGLGGCWTLIKEVV